ncbi:MAG TPA: LysE family translocator [Desulfobulbus sp.]|nr:LysE family translocator [Desulfobulbus sp.]
MHPYFSQFLTVVLVHLLAVASPGPDFAVVVRQSIVYGRKTAIWTSLGVGSGIFIHVGYSLLGIGLLVSRSIALFSVMKMVCALYLMYLGLGALRAKPMNRAELPGKREKNLPTTAQALRTGFFTNGLNPKATLFFLSLFTVVIDPATPLLIQAGYGLYMAVATALWFTGLSLLFGHGSVRRTFLKIGHWFDRLTGVVLIVLGLKVAFTERVH